MHREHLVEDPKLSEDLVLAMETLLSRYGPREQVTGVDLGFKHVGVDMTETIAVRIHVREKRPRAALSRRERFVQSIEGFPVDVLQGNYRTASTLDAARPPVQPGSSIGAAGGHTGTLGMFLRDADTRQLGLLSSAHILASAPGAGPGAAILQPGPADGGRAEDQIAELTRTHEETDAAFARLTTDRDVDPSTLRTGWQPTKLRYPVTGDRLEKSGRTTGVTRGIVDGLGHIAGLGFAISIKADPDGPAPIGLLGDSGAVWYDPESGMGVGLHAKGERIPTTHQGRVVATSLMIIAKKLRLELP